MNKKILFFCFFSVALFAVQMYQPAVSADPIISIDLIGYDKQGYFLYDIKNWGTTELERGIINISIDGGGIRYSLNVQTYLLIENLKPDENRTIKTNQPVFEREQFRILGRPLFGRFLETMEFGGKTLLARLTIFLKVMFEQGIPTAP